ncbi:hypothetical protein BDV18DRAFT_165572 [Aspergillus unguis]
MGYFLCSFESCKMEFVRKADLTRHYQIHLDNRPFFCEEEGCTKRFHQRSLLKIHQRVHTGEKPYVCEIKSCQRAFSDPSSYARHQKSHKNERPYVCHILSCKQSFSRKCALDRHQLRHHEQEKYNRSAGHSRLKAPIPAPLPTNMPPTLSFFPPSQFEPRSDANPPVDRCALDLSLVDDIIQDTIIDQPVPYLPYRDSEQIRQYPELPPP